MLFLLLLLTLTIVSKSSQQNNTCTKLEYYTTVVERTKVASYRITYYGQYWRIYTKWKFDTQHYTQVELKSKLVQQCCTGYSLHGDVCTPMCHGGCINSNCTAPQQCTCLKGYTKITDSRCIPYCDNCEYGLCSAPGICNCLKGYEKDETGTCKPKCTKECRNGVCTQPERCSCLSGYKLSEDSIFDCQPICEPSCEFQIKGSQCIAPNQCRCFEGYKLSPDEKECLPVCHHCTYGDCNAPGQCVCWEGYEKTNNDTCAPICDKGCVNAYCSSPQTCTCFEGYETDQYSQNQTECHPICEICENGECIAPEICNCWDGYEMDVNSTCIPKCSQTCENGYCSEPESCTCYDGYKMSGNDSYSCYPICEGCDNGLCIEPGNCSCWSGYEWNNVTFSCEPPRNLTLEILESNITKFGLPGDIYCDSLCLNETCLESNCYCQFESPFHNDSITKCNSTCDNSCEIEFCDQEVCACSYGYIFRNGSKCISMCKVDCENGYCIDPDICECLEGYLLDPSNTTLGSCIPLCNGNVNGCINGVCVNPDVCQCQEGFEKTLKSNFTCLPMKSLNESIYSQNTVISSIGILLAVLILVSSGFIVYCIQRKIRQRNLLSHEERHNDCHITYSPDGEHIKII